MNRVVRARRKQRRRNEKKTNKEKQARQEERWKKRSANLYMHIVFLFWDVRTCAQRGN